jgi:hypothetical protein
MLESLLGPKMIRTIRPIITSSSPPIPNMLCC